jgi:hypothetical protein
MVKQNGLKVIDGVIPNWVRNRLDFEQLLVGF